MEDVGKLDRYLSFCSATTTKTKGGAPQKGFAHSFYCWCSRTSVGEGSEQYLNERLANPYKYIYRTHYRDDVDETMRIIDDGFSYNILSIHPDGIMLEILAERVIE